MPFEEHRNLHAMLKCITRDERPDKLYTDPLARQRGLDLSIWSLIRKCWDTENASRPRMVVILEEIERIKVESVPKDVLTLESAIEEPKEDVYATAETDSTNQIELEPTTTDESNSQYGDQSITHSSRAQGSVTSDIDQTEKAVANDRQSCSHQTAVPSSKTLEQLELEVAVRISYTCVNRSRPV